MIKLNIITRCTKPQLLQNLKKSINRTSLFDVKWWVVFDTNVVKDIDAQFLSEVSDMGGQSLFFRGFEGDFGHTLLSKTIDLIDEGFIHFVDDDNILHNNLYESLYRKINENPDKLAFIISQEITWGDFSGLKIREAKPENVKVSKIDMAQFILHRKLIGEHRFIPGDYKADGYFIEEIYRLKPEKFHFIEEVLCHYNHQKTPFDSSPKVLFIGEPEPDLKSFKVANYESDKLNVSYLKNDTDIIRNINSFNADAIITNSQDWRDFTKLSNLPSDIRLRWIHLNELKPETGEISYRCAMNYILDRNKYSQVVSYFTPIYNTGEKLKMTYQSLRNQTNYNWEWVLVNDSTDGGKTLKIAESLAEDDTRIKIYDFRTKSGGIVGESKYRAAALTNGAIIAEFDHDDYLMPTCTQTLIEASQKYPECGFFFTDCVELDDNWNYKTYGDYFALGYGSYRDEIVFGKHMKVCQSNNINPKTIRHIVGVPNHVRAWRRKDYFNTGGYNRRLSIADDYELIIQTFLTTKMLRIRSNEYLQFLHNSGSNTHNLSRADIQRRVRTIAETYSLKIKARFEECGLIDWAYQENPHNPLLTESRFGLEEGPINLVWEKYQN